MRCESCATEVVVADRFCRGCGEPLAQPRALVAAGPNGLAPVVRPPRSVQLATSAALIAVGTGLELSLAWLGRRALRAALRPRSASRGRRSAGRLLDITYYRRVEYHPPS